MRAAAEVAAHLELEIAHLRGLDLDGLRARWRTLFGRRAPAHLPKHLLLRILAYRVQADALGDLDPATVRILERYAGPSGPAPALGPRLTPGTLLVRQWAGQQHRVTVLDEGFGWRDQTYRSLSEVARAITGTRWNGPRFFGLREERR